MLVSDYKAQNNWPYSWLSAQGLVQRVSGMGSIRVLEIGVSRGENAHYFLENCLNIVEYVGVDPYMPYFDVTHPVSKEDIEGAMADMQTNLIGFDNYRHVRATSEDAVKQFEDESFDYIFIDGDHSYEAVKRDINLYFSKCKTGGVFAGHDWNLSDVQQAVNEFRTKNSINAPLEQTSVQVWYWIK
jgi:predicted O-methyltransferase YrrM